MIVMGLHRYAWAGLLALLAGCPTVDLGDEPSGVNLCNPAGGREYFASEIYPNFVRPNDTANGCTKAGGCHNEADGQVPQFKTSPQDDAFNFRQAQQFLNCGAPEMSRLLTKPLAGVEPHGGEDIYFEMTEPEVQVFLGWFAE
jgi:hypothetical protein